MSDFDLIKEKKERDALIHVGRVREREYIVGIIERRRKNYAEYNDWAGKEAVILCDAIVKEISGEK